MDDTFCRAPRQQVRSRTGASWASWLPDIDLTLQEDRGEQGVRWTARTTAPGGVALAGSAEVWLEEVPGGTVAHLYVRLDPGPAPGRAPGRGPRLGRAGEGARLARRLPDRVRRTWKRGLHAWKDSLEGDAPT